MTAVAPSLPHTPALVPDKYRLALDEVMDMAMDVARLVHAEAKFLAGAPAAKAGDEAGAHAKTVAVVAAAFDRAARTVRRTASLAQQFETQAAEKRQAASRRIAGRREILRMVQDVIQQRAHGEQAEALQAELIERMDAPDVDGDIGERPLLEIANIIKHDLGLMALVGYHDYMRRTPADVAELGAVAARLPLPPRPAPGHPPMPAHRSTGIDPPSLADDPAMISLCNHLLGRSPPDSG